MRTRKIRLRGDAGRRTRPAYVEPKERPWMVMPPVDGFSHPLHAKSHEVPFWDGMEWGWHVFVWDAHARKDRLGNWVKDIAVYSYRQDRVIPYDEWQEVNAIRCEVARARGRRLHPA